MQGHEYTKYTLIWEQHMRIYNIVNDDRSWAYRLGLGFYSLWPEETNTTSTGNDIGLNIACLCPFPLKVLIK
jgi:hypothetical protein